MLVIFPFEGAVDVFGQPFAVLASRAMVEEHIDLVFLPPAVHVDEDAPFVLFLVFPREAVDGVAALLEPGNLVKGDGVAHAGFPFAVVQVAVVADAVLLVLYDDMHFRAACHQRAGEPQDDVVGVFVLVQFPSAYFGDGTGVGAAVPADQVEAGTIQFARLDFDGLECGAEKRFRDARPSTSGLFAFLSGGQAVAPSQEQPAVPRELSLVEFHEFLPCRARRVAETLQESGHAFAVARFGPFLSLGGKTETAEQ